MNLNLSNIFLHEMSLAEWNRFQIIIAKEVAKTKHMDVHSFVNKFNFFEIFPTVVDRNTDTSRYNKNDVVQKILRKIK